MQSFDKFCDRVAMTMLCYPEYEPPNEAFLMSMYLNGETVIQTVLAWVEFLDAEEVGAFDTDVAEEVEEY